MLYQLTAQLGPPSIIGNHLAWKSNCNQSFELFSHKWISYPLIRDMHNLNISTYSPAWSPASLYFRAHHVKIWDERELCLAFGK